MCEGGEEAEALAEQEDGDGHLGGRLGQHVPNLIHAEDAGPRLVRSLVHRLRRVQERGLGEYYLPLIVNCQTSPTCLPTVAHLVPHQQQRVAQQRGAELLRDVSPAPERVDKAAEIPAQYIL